MGCVHGVIKSESAKIRKWFFAKNPKKLFLRLAEKYSRIISGHPRNTGTLRVRPRYARMRRGASPASPARKWTSPYLHFFAFSFLKKLEKKTLQPAKNRKTFRGIWTIKNFFPGFFLLKIAKVNIDIRRFLIKHSVLKMECSIFGFNQIYSSNV